MGKKLYYSNGKLLITGEYLVLHGALSLAVPTIPGHSMRIEPIDEPGIIRWKSYYNNECWFDADFSLPGIQILNATNLKSAEYIQKLLKVAQQKTPFILSGEISYHILTSLDFRQEWGLGSSSSLINNLASWLEINPYELFFETQKGSGYDIACAGAEGPIWYRKVLGSPVLQKVSFDPAFKDKLCFVYSGKKQDSEKSVSHYLDSANYSPKDISRISEISRDIVSVKTLEEFNALLDEHEDIMSCILQTAKIKDEHFPDFPGSIKSLGAWGGDFLLASSEIGCESIKSYFIKKGLEVAFSFEELVLAPVNKM